MPAASTVWVTGAAGGIGTAVARRFQQSGATVLGTDLAATGPEACTRYVPLDSTDESAVEAFCQEVQTQYGSLQTLVHCVGKTQTGDLASTSLSDWNALLAANLTSCFLVAKHVQPLLEPNRASAVFIGSTNAHNGGSALSGAAYAVAKAGVENLVRYLAREWAEAGLRVNAVSPGPVETPMVTRFEAPVLKKLEQAGLRGRLGTPEEIAAAIHFLASPEADWITGVSLNLSGGLILR